MASESTSSTAKRKKSKKRKSKDAELSATKQEEPNFGQFTIVNELDEEIMCWDLSVQYEGSVTQMGPGIAAKATKVKTLQHGDCVVILTLRKLGATWARLKAQNLDDGGKVHTIKGVKAGETYRIVKGESIPLNDEQLEQVHIALLDELEHNTPLDQMWLNVVAKCNIADKSENQIRDEALDFIFRPWWRLYPHSKMSPIGGMQAALATELRPGGRAVIQIYYRPLLRLVPGRHSKSVHHRVHH